MTHPKNQKVLLATPHGHEVSARWVKSVLALVAYDIGHHQRIVNGGNYLLNSSGANVTNARNEIVDRFLDDTTIDWLWFCDTDMTFDPDVVDRLVKAAHPETRPIVGGLCFSLQDGYRACPTLYVIREDNRIGRVLDYPRNTLMRVMTGTGCLLIHRSALLTMREKFPKPYQWFQETAVGDLPLGEDITFCLRAEAIGIPVHVDTSIKVGHEKPFIVDEAMYDAQRQAGVEDTPEPVAPTYVVIPVKDRHEMTQQLLDSLDGYEGIFLFDNGSEVPARDALRLPDRCYVFAADGWPLHQMWNQGLDWAVGARCGTAFNVAILNNDIEVEPGFLGKLAAGLRQREDNWIAYPNWHAADIPDGAAVPTRSDKLAGQTMSGWAFMLRGETGLRFDEQFAWWYGDSDIQKQVEAAGKHVVCVGGCHARHLEPMKSTMTDAARLAQARDDERKFAEKWGIDPASLWLAQQDAA